MECITGLSLLPQRIPQGSAVALGYFDGVHLGHQKVVGAAVRYARAQAVTPAVFTFTFGGVRAKGRNLYTEAARRAALRQTGVQLYAAPPFESFHALSAEAFVETVLCAGFRAKAVFCGENFRFGHGAQGDVTLLKTLCAARGVEVFICETAYYQGLPVSSTRIRAALSEGDMPAVNAMLGRTYEISFSVRHGKKLGRTLGFPTINQVYPADMHTPRYGIYITGVCLDGKEWPAATGFGERPTVNGSGATCESFIPGFEGNLYDETPAVRFYEYLAPSRKFDTLEELKSCVFEAAEAAKAYFKNRKQT